MIKKHKKKQEKLVASIGQVQLITNGDLVGELDQDKDIIHKSLDAKWIIWGMKLQKIVTVITI